MTNLGPPEHRLRRTAEERLRAGGGDAVPPPVAGDPTRLVHELRVHQMELELQNDELRRAHERLEASRARYADLWDHAPTGYLTLDEGGRIVEANLTAATLLGLPREGLQGRPMTDFILPEDQDVNYCRRHELLETARPQAFELRLKRKGAPPFWARLEVTAAPDAETGTTLCRVALSDVTERRRARDERERAEAEKLEAVVRLAGGVAHGFNNMLCVIQGNVELAMEKVDSSDPLFADLQQIRLGARRSAELTRQLLAFARREVISPELTELSRALVGQLPTLRRLLGAKAKLTWSPSPDALHVLIDPVQLHLVLVNLVVNARDAVAEGGVVSVATSLAVLDHDTADSLPDAAPGRYARLEVADDGCGMAEEVVRHIFEPFFTTREVGKGTGMGLATVYGIVRQNDGFVTVESEPDRGSTFRVHLPLHDGPAAP